MSEAMLLMDQFSRSANGHKPIDVIDAAANLLLNALRQNNSNFDKAKKELNKLFFNMEEALRERHYTESGDRKIHNIIIPPIKFDLN